MNGRGDITLLLSAAREGDTDAAARLAVLVYDELRRIARHRQPAADETLSTTALVHETYLRVFGEHGASFPDRNHFYAYAAQAMRRLVTDHARRRAAGKRGGGAQHIELDEALALCDASPERIIALDQMLTRLQEMDARLARMVELRVFAGLDTDELSAALEVSTRTVKRDWRRARAILGAWLGQGTG